ncbi:phage major capsid protein [Aestuariivirga litoralis]|uniref:phage major capsid protein n=1 Tax=Aestuariivirga litoralis TaxID=2650924 RepID=UPI0018C5B9F0|nr:phage major capsid protein [Aestuariivirga litoralis]MBG1232979.1 phage major capsid protein [Aestuariivirga litoralis]
MDVKDMKLPVLHRAAELTYRQAGEGESEDTVEFSFSSEEPYERWFGFEVLGHKDSEVNMDWMMSGRAPLLVDHKTGVDDQIGVITKAWIEGGRGKAIARFGKDKRSQKIKERVKSGDLTNISVGYRVLEMELVTQRTDGPDTYRVTRWQPMENSIVTIPADPTIGVGRKGEKAEHAVKIVTKSASEPPPNPINTGTKTMTKENENAASWQESARSAGYKPEADVLAAERSRIAEIEKIGAQFNRGKLASEHVAKGTSVDQFRGVMLDEVGAETVAERNEAQHNIGLSRKEAQQFRFTRLITALSPSAKRAEQDAARFELDAIEAASKGRDGKALAKRGYAIPMEVLRTPLVDETRTAMNVGTAANGGNLVATNLLSQDFITLLRNKILVQRMGATVLTGLEGFVALPRQTGGATGAWLAESGSSSPSQQTLDQVSLSPKTFAASTEISRRLLLQSSLDVESLVRGDIAAVIALGIDLGALHGSGSSNQPTGLAGQTGVNVVALGTNGAAPAWADMVNMETQIAVANADVANMGYLSNAKVRGKLKTTLVASSAGSDFIWGKELDANGFGQVNGYKAGVSNQVSSTLTKGSASGICSGIFFGNWADLLIGQWSGLDMLVDPYSNSLNGALRIVAFMDVDVACRHGQSFSYIADALTT